MTQLLSLLGDKKPGIFEFTKTSNGRAESWSLFRFCVRKTSFIEVRVDSEAEEVFLPFDLWELHTIFSYFLSKFITVGKLGLEEKKWDERTSRNLELSL